MRRSWQIKFLNLVLIFMVTAKSKLKVNHRRSKEEIAAEKAAKEERRAARLAEQARRQEAAAAVRAQMAKQDHDRRLAHEDERRRQRLFQEAGVEWLMGYDTPAAKLFGKYVESYMTDLARKAQQAQRAGDPLGLTRSDAAAEQEGKESGGEKGGGERQARGRGTRCSQTRTIPGKTWW